MQAKLLQQKDIDHIAWNELVKNSPQGSIFMQSWYINAALENEWQGILVYHKEQLQAVMPLYMKSKYFLEYSFQPILAKYWGICFAKNHFPNHYEEFSWKKKVVDTVISTLPKLSKFYQSFHHNFDYFLPFYWKKFAFETKFTYILPLKNALDIENNFSKSVLKKIRKAEKNELEIRPETDVEFLLKLLEENEKSNKLILPKEHFESYKRVQKACAAHEQCFMLSVFNEKNEGVASGLFLQDLHTTYFLSGIVSPAYRQSAAMPLLVTEAIKKASGTTQNFDFMGSMIESIESFFRSFGPKPVPYMSVKKNVFPFKI